MLLNTFMLWKLLIPIPKNGVIKYLYEPLVIRIYFNKYLFTFSRYSLVKTSLSFSETGSFGISFTRLFSTGSSSRSL